jgi:hypothetical protein
MALTGERWFVVYDLIESSGKGTRRRYEMNAPADYAAAVAAEASFRTDLLAVTDCVIRSYHIYQEYVEDALAYPVGVEKENEALLTFEITDNPAKSATLSIPGASDGIFAATTGPNRDIVDTADADIVAFTQNFQPAAQGGNDLMLLSDGEQADNLIGGKRRHVGRTSS